MMLEFPTPSLNLQQYSLVFYRGPIKWPRDQTGGALGALGSLDDFIPVWI